MEAINRGHFSVMMWFGENGEPFTRGTLSQAMYKNNLPMVRYMMQYGALEVEDGCHPQQRRSVSETWLSIFCHSHLAVLAFVYSRAFGGKIPADLILEKAVQRAICDRSLPLLRWLQQNGIHFDAVSAQRYAVSHFDRHKEIPVLDWLQRQVRSFAEHY